MESSAKKDCIFVIDDNPVNVTLLQKMLVELNYSVRVAIRGSSALKSIQMDLPDLILMDLKMPEMDGYEVCEKLKNNQHTKNIPIIFISAMDEINAKVKALNTGGVDYITKPFQIDDLSVRVRTHLSIRKMQKKLEMQNIEFQQEIIERKRAETALKEAYDMMDERVKERTHELSISNLKLKASLIEKEVLLREVHHRVKNNMQIISTLLMLQSDKIEDKQYTDMFKECQYRIKAMALVHENLYQTGSFADIDFKEYVNSLVHSLLRSYGAGSDKITLKIDIKDVSLGLENAIPCGLIINELVSNSLKYAFPENREGEIMIALYSINSNELVLEVGDNGIGIPEKQDFINADSIGLLLVKILSEDQLEGKIELNRDHGTLFHIEFKKQLYIERL